MLASYDEQISEHYKKVAGNHQLLSSSTMEDNIVRERETDAILTFVRVALSFRSEHYSSGNKPVRIMDVGCGNGFTLSRIAALYPDVQLVAIDNSEAMLTLTMNRFYGNVKVASMKGDIRDSGFMRDMASDIIISQRVLINILSRDDQKQALKNIIDGCQPGTALCFIEGFEQPLQNLNVARSEFDLEPLLPAEHNLYLPNTFFDHPKLASFETASAVIDTNFLSTHYYVSRVAHAAVTTGNGEFKRNSEFVKFFSNAFRHDIGDYSPLKFLCFLRV
jgi:SAM-dependent methyltransferase